MSSKSESLWPAVVVFVSAIAVSRLLQHKFEKEERKEQNHNLRKLYKMKRLNERMSYHNGMSHQQPLAGSKDNSTNGRASKTNTISYDYLRKNRNWCHFETHEEDRIEASADSSAASLSSDTKSTNGTHAQNQQGSRKLFDGLAPSLKAGRSLSAPAVPSTWAEHLTESFHTFRKSISSALSESDHGSQSSHDCSFAGNGGSQTNGDGGASRVPSRSSSLKNPLEGRRRIMWDSRIMSDEAHGPTSNQDLCASYNARIMPNKVVLIRHGQSEGNINERLYSTTPDNAMRITKLGWEQAKRAGEILKHEVIASGEPIHFIVSPYVRTVETFHGIVSAWCNPDKFKHIADREERLRAWYRKLHDLGITWREDPRIREQDFGNYQNPEKIKKSKEERHHFGPFFYRFAHGESASDVFDRVSTFLDSLWRSFDVNHSRNYVLVTHGISIRVLLARYFHYSIAQFSMLANPRNCEMVVLGHDGRGKLELEGRCQLEMESDDETGEQIVTGHVFHKRLKVLPKRFMHKLNIRMSCDDEITVPPADASARSTASCRNLPLESEKQDGVGKAGETAEALVNGSVNK